MTDPNNETAEGWHMDKKVPVALILGLIAQTVFLVVWATKLDARVGVLEAASSRQDAFIEARVKLNETRWEVARDRIGRLEEATGFIKEGIQRIERKLDASGHP